MPWPATRQSVGLAAVSRYTRTEFINRFDIVYRPDGRGSRGACPGGVGRGPKATKMIASTARTLLSMPRMFSFKSLNSKVSVRGRIAAIAVIPVIGFLTNGVTFRAGETEVAFNPGDVLFHLGIEAMD